MMSQQFLDEARKDLLIDWAGRPLKDPNEEGMVHSSLPLEKHKNTVINQELYHYFFSAKQITYFTI